MLKILKTLHMLEKAKADKAALAHAKAMSAHREIRQQLLDAQGEQTHGLEVPLDVVDPIIRSRWLYHNTQKQAAIESDLAASESVRQQTGHILRRAIAKTTALQEVITTKEAEARLQAERKFQAQMMENYQ